MDENFRMHWARERARRASLAAMGITPFVSRFDAPGAKASERFDMPDEELSEPTLARQGVIERGPVDQLRVVLGQKDGQGLPEVEPEVANHVTPSIKGQAKLSLLLLPRMSRSRFCLLPVVMFSGLRCSRINYSAKSSCSWSQPWHAPFAVSLCGANISSSIGHPQGKVSWRLPIMGWRRCYPGFLQRLTRDHSTELMVLMGDCDCLPSSGITQYRIPSSLSMLRDGSLKETAWATLKPLIAVPERVTALQPLTADFDTGLIEPLYTASDGPSLSFLSGLLYRQLVGPGYFRMMNSSSRRSGINVSLNVPSS